MTDPIVTALRGHRERLGWTQAGLAARAGMSVYTVRELVAMLGAAGLATREIFGSVAEEPFALGAERLLLVAEKS